MWFCGNFDQVGKSSNSLNLGAADFKTHHDVKTLSRHMPQARRLLVTGSRDWADRPAICETPREAWWHLQPGPIVLVYGAAQGADSLAADRRAGSTFPVEAHLADWKTHGKKAGVVRNQALVDLVCALPVGGCETTGGVFRGGRWPCTLTEPGRSRSDGGALMVGCAIKGRSGCRRQ
ncbi:SLOG family protein [Nocardia sp. NPDC001965]